MVQHLIGGVLKYRNSQRAADESVVKYRSNTHRVVVEPEDHPGSGHGLDPAVQAAIHAGTCIVLPSFLSIFRALSLSFYVCVCVCVHTCVCAHTRRVHVHFDLLHSVSLSSHLISHLISSLLSLYLSLSLSLCSIPFLSHTHTLTMILHTLSPSRSLLTIVMYVHNQ